MGEERLRLREKQGRPAFGVSIDIVDDMGLFCHGTVGRKVGFVCGGGYLLIAPAERGRL